MRDAATDRTRLSSSGKSLAFSSPVSVAATALRSACVMPEEWVISTALPGALDLFNE
jgi:hypothetical protein